MVQFADQILPAETVIDFKADIELRNLYIAHPYFNQVLMWLNGKLPYQKICHFHSDRQFRSRVLPEVISTLVKSGLLSILNGEPRPTYQNLVLLNVPEGIASQMVLASHAYQSVVRRAANGLGTLKVRHVRTCASQDKINEWSSRIAQIFSEIEEHNEACGTFVTFCSLSTVGE